MPLKEDRRIANDNSQVTRGVEVADTRFDQELAGAGAQKRRDEEQPLCVLGPAHEVWNVFGGDSLARDHRQLGASAVGAPEGEQALIVP